MFRIEMLPAAHGDCLWVEWSGEGGTNRMLIDGGPAQTYPYLRERIAHLPEAERHFELLVVTHIDADHIEGIVRLLQDAAALKLSFKRIWFNGLAQLKTVPGAIGDVLGALQGEYLSLLIKDVEAAAGHPLLNLDLPAAYAGVADVDALPEVPLKGGLKLTLLSPNHPRLHALAAKWPQELEEAGMEGASEDELRAKLAQTKALRDLGDVLGGEDPAEHPELPTGATFADALGGGGAPGSDTSVANGSSIAFLAEHEGATFLLTGDAYAGVLVPSIKALLTKRGAAKLKLNGFKLAHHGSIGNITQDLLDLLDCRSYLVSTSGAKFKHPDAPAVEMILAHHRSLGTKPTLYFNYLTSTTQPWSQLPGANATYESVFPKGMSLSLS